MKRCPSSPRYLATLPLAGLVFCLAIASWSSTSLAQSADEVAPLRNFPATALRGELVLIAPPEISMDGRAERLAPGARIRNVDNLNVLPGNFLNKPLVVNYTRDNIGQVHQVWILNSEEAKEKRAGGPAPRNFTFGFESSGPAKDDGKTPYDKLPRY